MKYKIISKKTISHKSTALVPFNAPTPQRYDHDSREQILLESLFEFAALPEVPAPKRATRRKIHPRARNSARVFFKKLDQSIEVTQKRVIRSYLRTLIFLSALGSTVALISTFVFFGRFIIPHSTLTVPSFVGNDVRELTNTEEYELIISYENHSELAAGTVISQTPPAYSERKLYRTDGPCRIFLSVSAGKRSYDIPNLIGKSERDAQLALKNSGIPTKTVTQYSNTAEAGTVMEIIPPPGEKLYEGEILTLKISLGRRILSVYVPSLFGMNEAQASAAIRSAGLTLGKITYQSSDITAGKVISQQYTPFSRVNSGQSIDIVVSLGNSYVQKYVPELYGMTVEDAAESLETVGLVIGNIYAVSSGAPKGTVISQSVAPSTPINSNITSVDIYVSS